MTAKRPGKIKKRVLRSWITSTVSISMVLLMLGFLLLILVNARTLSDYIREKIGFTLVMHDEVRKVDIIRLQKSLAATGFVKETRYIDKKTAAHELSEELGEDFVDFLGYNPLFASIEIRLFAPYTKQDSLRNIEKKLSEYPQVKEVYYQKNLVAAINKNVHEIGIILLTLSILMIIIFISLINNTIRISIYSQRFTIHTMQLVGATRSFVRKPFIARGLTLGVAGALIANLLIWFSTGILHQQLAGLIHPGNIRVLGVVFLLVFALGIAIAYFSTLFAVNKFLKMKFDELFY